jgi:DNA helicase HerA-like ATPase
VSLLDGVQFHRLLSVPRRSADSQEPDQTSAQLFGALTATHAELANDVDDGVIVSAWEQRPGQRQIRVLVGGRPFFPPAGREQHPVGYRGSVLYPPGSVGETLESAEVTDAWKQLPAWVRCVGRYDPLWTPANQSSRKQQRGGFNDYVAHLTEPFVWLVVAKPLSVDTIDRELLDWETRIPTLRRRENSELGRVELERAEARYRELSRARASGMWDVHVLVGGPSSGATRQAAALLCGASDLDELPYALHPDTKVTSYEEVLSSTIAGRDEPSSPFSASAELLVALNSPPRRELPGIRLVERVDFDVTPESDGGIPLGYVLDEADQPVGPFTVSNGTLNRHTFVAGATGSGKSQTVRHLLEGLHNNAVPWMVIEPAKAEYARMAGRIGGDQVVVIHPGDPDVIPVGLNPLEPEPGFPLQTHIDMVRALFMAAFDAEEPFPQILSKALDECYRNLGWDLVLSESKLPGVVPRYPRLGDLQSTALEVVKNIGYGREVLDNVRGFIDVRIGSLRLGTPGRFFEGGYPVDIEKLLRRNVVLEIEDIGSDSDKAFFIGAVIIRLVEHLRVKHARSGKSATGLLHVTVIEEAHRLLKKVEPGSPAAHAVELFTSLLAEIRAYGEGIIVAEQIPDKIIPDVLKNTALKIIHRLPAADDREAVGSTMNVEDAQSRHLVSLAPGRAAVFSDGMDRPIRIAIPLGEQRESAEGVSRVADVKTTAKVLLTLSELNAAQRLAENPGLILWIEMLTAAHLVGRPAPQPDQEWLSELLTLAEPNIVARAVEHRIELSVDSRYGGLADYYQPEGLIGHLSYSAVGLLTGYDIPCDGTEVEWQAGRYRWFDVVQKLDAGIEKLKEAGAEDNQSHADTEAWTQRGLFLSGKNLAEQWENLRNRPDYWSPPHSILIGGESPPAYESAVLKLSRESAPEDRFLEASRYLNLKTNWPVLAFNIKRKKDEKDEKE